LSDQWDFYFARVNGEVASMFVDLGLFDASPDDTRPWLLWIWVYLQHPRPDGFPDGDEQPVLGEIENALVTAMQSALDAIQVGRITTAGRREFYFYAPAADGFDAALSSALAGFPGYRSDSGAQMDTEWSQYRDFLYPSPMQLLQIRDSHLLETLEQHGDQHEIPRPIVHWAYFKSPKDRDGFLASVEPLGFSVLERSTDDELELPFGASFERVEPIDTAKVHETTSQLWHLAGEFDGTYDGWETSVERGI